MNSNVNATLQVLNQIGNDINRIAGMSIPLILTGSETSPVGKYYWFYKGSGTPGVITEMLDSYGNKLPSTVISFLNNEVSEGQYFMIPFSKITISSGNIAIGITNY